MENKANSIGKVETKQYDSKNIFIKSSLDGYEEKYESETLDLNDTSLNNMEPRSTSSGSNARTVSRGGTTDFWDTESIFDVWLSNDTVDWEKGFNNGKPYWTNKNNDSIYIYKDFDTFVLVIDGEEYYIPKEFSISELEQIDYDRWKINDYMYVEKRWDSGYNIKIVIGSYEISTMITNENIDTYQNTSASTNVSANEQNSSNSQEESSSAESVPFQIRAIESNKYSGMILPTNYNDSLELFEDIFNNYDTISTRNYDYGNDIVTYTKTIISSGVPVVYQIVYFESTGLYILHAKNDPYSIEVFKQSSTGEIYKFGNGFYDRIPNFHHKMEPYENGWIVERDNIRYYYNHNFELFYVSSDFEYNGKIYSCYNHKGKEIYIELKSKGHFDNELTDNKEEIAQRLGLTENYHWSTYYHE